MWTSDESVGPRAPVGACFDLLSLSKKGQERSKSRWASSPASIHPSSVERSLSVGRSALRQALRLPSGVPPYIGLSVFRRAFRAPSASPSSVGNSALRRVLISAIRRPLSVPPPVERFALRRALRLPPGVPPSVGLSVLCRAIRLPSGVLLSIGVSAFRRTLHRPSSSPFWQSVVRWASRPTSSDLRTVSSSCRQVLLQWSKYCILQTLTRYLFKRYEDYVLH